MRLSNFLRLFFFLLLLGSWLLEFSASAWEISALGNVMLPNFDQAAQLAAQTSGQISLGGMLLGGLEISEDPKFSIETGVSYSARNIRLTNIRNGGNNGVLSYNPISIPVVAHYHALDYLSIDVGGYIGISSTASIKIETGGGSTQPVSLGTNDTGLIGGVTGKYRLFSNLLLRGSAWVEYGLTDISNGSTAAIHSLNFDLLMGATFTF